MKSVLFATTALALTASAALAADLPSRRAPPVYVPPPVPVFTWTGFEAGLHSAYTFGSNNHVSTVGTGTPAGDNRLRYLSTQKDGFANVGAGLAYNYQFTPGNGFVIGAAVDADWVDLDKNAYVLTSPSLLSIYHQRLDWLGTANGRLGYAFGRFLVYGTGGYAFGDPGVGGVFTAPGAQQNRYIGGNNGQLKGGYDYGGGFEYAIPEDSFFNKFAFERIIFKQFGLNATTILKAEYIHYDLGSETVRLGSTGIPGAGGSYSQHYHTEGNQVRAGLTYLFGPPVAAPVVARY